jgi:hypothetical protein
MEIGRGYFECNIDLRAGEMGEENCDGNILSVPKKYDRDVPSGHTVWKLRICLRWYVCGTL